MPVSFVRLRIAGFKSFAEPAVVEILPGLTGVVGPNGCGKSNVVEALRWAMGENSARTLRGGEMDDVIFAGTANRPSRNLAEVTLTLEDAAGLAPPPFHDLPDLQISRRLERGAGSSYRVNNREARARDVQTLFADLGSGARSSAMVSQGRVAAIVSARPDERRSVLEEAAGITGLHARRHEAELKLRAAEANLLRAEDRRGQLEAQLDGLRRQARQSARFRAMNGMVAAAEGELLALVRARAERDRALAGEAFAAAEAGVAATAQAATQAAAMAEETDALLPGLRAAESDARGRLERARLLREGASAERQRAQAALDAASARQAQVARDLGHAAQLGRDASDAVRRLVAEHAAISQADRGYEERIAALAADLDAARAALGIAETNADMLAAEAAALGARHESAKRRLRDAQARAGRAAEASDRADAAQAAAERQVVDPARLAGAEAALNAATAARTEAGAALDAAERARALAASAAAQARMAFAAADTAWSRLQAEASGLAELLAASDKTGAGTPVGDEIVVPQGLEAAVAAALAEALSATTDPASPRHWRPVPNRQAAALPRPALLTLVEAPPFLRPALAAVGLADDGGDAQMELEPGQSLVSRDGALWRWDGYTVRPGAPSAAAVRLQQRNRLRSVQSNLAEAKATRAVARAARDAADAAEKDALAAEARARAARREAEPQWERASATLAAMRTDAASAASRLLLAAEAAARQRHERFTAQAELSDADAEAAGLPDADQARTAARNARAALSVVRSTDAAAARALDAARSDHGVRSARARVIGAEMADWDVRARDAADRVTDLRARAADAEREHHSLAVEPDRVRRAEQDASATLLAAEDAHRRAANALETGQARADTSARAQRAADAAATASREALLRAEAALTAAEHASGAVAERILERLGPNASLPHPPADLSASAEERARRKLDRLLQERDAMGPVNLRAEIEAEEVGKEVDTLLRERDEIGTAVARLRGSIGHINREGRERLAEVFTKVDRHFQVLFSRMFGGGRAHLATVGSDDLLDAGLEIYAQPPGKKLAALSLLSGGEQALTALSLVFAIFRCRPAPLCVLDEVDAPLDDANVERFCTLLHDMARETGTRFLVVTHHAYTMARMDRLFGITMQERGVSRVLSVDLQQATAMAERTAAE